jgi:hypothetical protein
MIWHFHSGHGSRAAMLVAGIAVSCDGGSSCVAVGEPYRVDQQNGHSSTPG